MLVSGLAAVGGCEASGEQPKGKLERRNKEVACGGKRKEEKQLSSGFQPDHAPAPKHTQTRSDVGSQGSVGEAAGRSPGRKQKRRMRPDTRLSGWKKTSQVGEGRTEDAEICVLRQHTDEDE